MLTEHGRARTHALMRQNKERRTVAGAPRVDLRARVSDKIFVHDDKLAALHKFTR